MKHFIRRFYILFPFKVNLLRLTEHNSVVVKLIITIFSLGLFCWFYWLLNAEKLVNFKQVKIRIMKF